MQSIRSINTKNFELSQVQTNLINVLRQIANKEIVDGVALDNVTISTLGTTLSHGLSRQPLGFIVIDKGGPGDIYRTSWDHNNISLTSTSTVSCSLWVF